MAEQGTVAKVAAMPTCDFCRMNGADVPAGFDGKTKMGAWANMCPTHFGLYGIGLGTGKGQRLVMEEPDKVELIEPIVKVTTPPCMLCNETSLVELTREEFTKLIHPSQPRIDKVLPNRDLDFRELVMTGTHSACWDVLTKPLDDEDAEDQS
jgi:hypothetical protein